MEEFLKEVDKLRGKMIDVKNIHRAKSKQSGKWVMGIYSPLNWDEYGEREQKPQIIIISENKYIDGLWCEIEPETASRYIGRNDRKGKPIFGGDIFFIYGEYDNGLYTEDRSGYVYVDYNNERCQWELRNSKGKWLDSFYNYIEDFEDEREGCVCGNIHDNPELLKGGAGK